MNILKLSWRNLFAQPLSTILSLVLFALGVGLISLILLLNHQLDDKFERNLAGIDMVVGAKGSPLQIILCSIFHIDFPTGNIPLRQANGLKRNPMIEKAIDMALGDSYKGYRIVGTTTDYVDLYEGKTAEGKLWGELYEVTLGATVAEKLELKLGDAFQSSHGFADDGFGHEGAEDFKVVGILESTGSVLDQLILTNVKSVWAVHDGHGVHPDSVSIDDRELTSMLLFFRNRMAAVKLPRMINENTDMQAASPAFEMTRLYNMMGAGESILRWLAIIIIGVSGLSVFISLFNSLRSRKYELALMRVSGASRIRLFFMILLEGLIIAILGYIIGIALSHIGMQMLSGYLSEEYRYDFTGWMFLPAEWVMLAVALLIGFFAAVIPALMAFTTDISKTLSKG